MDKKPRNRGPRLRGVKLYTRGGEVDRASFQMVNNDISVMFFHFKNGAESTYQMEGMHGNVLSIQKDARGNFRLWVAKCIKEVLTEKVDA